MVRRNAEKRIRGNHRYGWRQSPWNSFLCIYHGPRCLYTYSQIQRLRRITVRDHFVLGWTTPVKSYRKTCPVATTPSSLTRISRAFSTTCKSKLRRSYTVELSTCRYSHILCTYIHQSQADRCFARRPRNGSRRRNSFVWLTNSSTFVPIGSL